MMRRSNRRLLSTIAAGAALALVAGCGGEKTDTDASIDGRWYPEKDYHYIYFAEIEKVLISE